MLFWTNIQEFEFPLVEWISDGSQLQIINEYSVFFFEFNKIFREYYIQLINQEMIQLIGSSTHKKPQLICDYNKNNEEKCNGWKNGIDRNRNKLKITAKLLFAMKKASTNSWDWLNK